MMSPLVAQLADRVVATGDNRIEWLRARSFGITATDAARLCTPTSVHSVAYDKINGTGFGGNEYTEYGRHREAALADRMQSDFGIAPSRALYRAAQNPRHLATPDGVGTTADGSRILLGEIKTSTKPFTRPPRNYLRQIWWQQYVIGAERTLLVWEQHHNFIPTAEPVFTWVDRDDTQIAALIALADQVLTVLARPAQV